PARAHRDADARRGGEEGEVERAEGGGLRARGPALRHADRPGRDAHAGPPAHPAALPVDGLQAGLEGRAEGSEVRHRGHRARLPEYCRVDRRISPIDPAAPNILFRVALPTAWNSKAVMFGGGGFNGSIPNVAGNVPAGPANQLTPLGRGYATFASDSGHQANE